MSMTNSYRYEVMIEKTLLKAALNRQEARIKTDEDEACRNKALAAQKRLDMIANWETNLDDKCWSQKALREHKESQVELAQASKSNIMVRQAALKHLLEKERKIYEAELNRSGKAFFLQRM